MIKISMITLGCVKNTVDSEAIMALFKEPYFKITTDLNDTDAIIINTCGFIESAKVEAINTILDCLKYNKKLIVIGCLVERFYKELVKEIPEVDLWIKFKDEYTQLPQMISKLFNNEVELPEFSIFNRVVSTDKTTCYLKISEGCNRFCGFCAIPYIRGRFVSYDEDELVEYAKNAAKDGAKELVLIGQDPTSYGMDLKDKNINLVHLLRRLNEIEGFVFIRCLYMYPHGITKELVDFIRDNKKMVHYFDIPIQHISNNVLKEMHRVDTKESTIEKLNYIKEQIPDAVFRTTLIVGYPNETKEDFEELLSFVNDFKFNHLGVFTFSCEEGTYASHLKNIVSEEEAMDRKEAIMKKQATISYRLNQRLIGKEMDAVIIKKDRKQYIIRTSYDAPDDIDGKVILMSQKEHNPGDVVKVKVTNALVYDLLCEEI